MDTGVHRDYVDGGIIGKCITNACSRLDLYPCARDALSISALNGPLFPDRGSTISPEGITDVATTKDRTDG